MPIARTLLVLALAAGCDLQPPPKQQAKAAQAAPAAAARPGADGGSGRPAPAKLEITQPCAEAGVKTAELMIAATVDPNERAVLEHDRTRLVRRTAETCTREAWGADTLACVKAATNPQALAARAKARQPAR